MADKNHIYITSTLPYVNSDPHVGFAMEIIRADSLARYYRAGGNEVFFNTGTDEHGAKIHEAATKEGIDTKSYTDRFAARFQELKTLLNLSVDNFVRTTDEHHIMAAQEFWKRCAENGDIYKKLYKVKYCVGCELEKTESELDEKGHCPLHPNRELEIREEENYFFRWSKYQEPLLKFYETHPDFVIPDFRGNEMKAFVGRGLEDFSISRLRAKMPWGIPVPGDEEHVMYVWFDALVNYISAIGWPDRMDEFAKWWPVIQYCGKDNNRQQSAMWQAMLMSAKLPNSKHIVIDGFITSGGQKMSKSIGNVISPYDVAEFFRPYAKYPEDVLRFVLLHDLPSFEDGDLTMEGIKAGYAANLQNGIGNLTSRILKMVVANNVEYKIPEKHVSTSLDEAFAVYDLHRAIGLVWKDIGDLDKMIQEQEPFKVVKTDSEKGKQMMADMVLRLWGIAVLLEPFLPNTAKEIQRLIKEHKMPETPLFNRLP